MWILWASLGIIGFKFMLNFSKWIYLRYISNHYVRLEKTRRRDMYQRLVRHKPRTIALLKDAGIGDGIRPAAIDLRTVSTESAFFLFPGLDPNVFAYMMQSIEQAIGVYGSRMVDAISPLYWAELLVFLPRRAGMAIWKRDSGCGIWILQVVYWALPFVAAYFFPQFKQFITYLLEKIESALTNGTP